MNQPEASDGWLTEDALWLVSKTVSDKLRAHLLSQGIDGIPANNTAVFNVLQDHGMLQPTPDGKAIWRATVTSSSACSHAFTLLQLAPALIWEPGERPAPFAGMVAIDAATAEEEADASAAQPAVVAKLASEDQATPPWEAGSTASLVPSPTTQSAPDALEDMLAMVGMGDSPGAKGDAEVFAGNAYAARPDAPILAAAIAPASSPAAETASKPVQPSGEHFVAWLKQGIASRRLIINDTKTLVHTVSDMAYLVNPGVFQRYAQEHPQVRAMAKQENLQDWQWAQKRFEKLGLHRKQASGLNIWNCDVMGPRKSRRLHGYLLKDAHLVFVELQPNNPYLSLTQDR